MKKKYSEFFNKEDKLVIRDDIPFYGSVNDLENIYKVSKNCLVEIKKSRNIRHIVLETWLLLDFFVREMLINGFDLRKYNLEAYDLRYELFPIAFRKCAEILLETLEIQRSLNEKPVSNYVTYNAKFLFFIKKTDINVYNKLLELEQEYYRKYYPELVKTPGRISYVTASNNAFITTNIQFKPIYYCINKGWSNALKPIDKDWLNIALRINNARNKAAHSFDSQLILSSLGFSGNDAFKLAKKECIKIIDTLLGIKFK